ncbi:glycosyltransferase involved in cell wall biosynthesis [Melghiribacillus thermohalophilus]|uniref:Glycosyltransferase involved in cell wall biosynthesis n=1 Tax=Melghiribacillus thermohalophilus TaxID=1324956 RepID=A0A4R3NC97_9BACI|nr:glycosyltransferase family 2 protein [Melghiribacillus thermohalophilus]TCT26458.1 glycosyltransferase involved in cell wall biosynthesis [Melghiribacillus thermohalophilus]
MRNKDENDKDLVSVIIPAYNCEKFIGSAIESVISQTYNNWEAIVIDDCSTDRTGEIIKSYLKKEPRIRYFRLDKNSGAAAARNKAIELANGKYLAFLDSDDIWHPEKLSRQITFMKQNGYNFTCTSYSKVGENGNDLNRIVEAKAKSDYEGLLKHCPGNSTVIYNAEVLGKFEIPNIKKRNDYILWLQIIKEEKYIYGLKEVLASHRERDNSISSNKISLVSYHWKIYREYEHLSLVKSMSLLIYWILKAIIKIK